MTKRLRNGNLCGMISMWILVAHLVVGQTPGTAQPWRVRLESEVASGGERRSATVTDAAGFSLTVEPQPGSAGARCTVTVPSEVGEIDADELPVLEVDARPPQQVLRWEASDEWEDGGDFMEAMRRHLGVVPLVGLDPRSVTFLCWDPLPRQVTPTRGLLRQLLDGRELIARLPLAGGEYREAVFSLDGAREAISEALEIPAEPDRHDILQDELLAFRVDYRSTTCYLLNGKKRRDRCLEAVEQCRLTDHDSVVAMTGCIESD